MMKKIKLYKDVILKVLESNRYGTYHVEGYIYGVKVLTDFRPTDDEKKIREYYSEFFPRKDFVKRYNELKKPKKKIVFTEKQKRMIRASLVAGLNTFGISKDKTVMEYARKMKIDTSKIKKSRYGLSGLVWSYPTKKFKSQKASAIIYDLSEEQESNDYDDVMNWGEFSYFFDMYGKAYPADEGFIKARRVLRSPKNKMYLYSAEDGTITLVHIDLENVKEIKKYLKTI